MKHFLWPMAYGLWPVAGLGKGKNQGIELINACVHSAKGTTEPKKATSVTCAG